MSAQEWIENRGSLFNPDGISPLPEGGADTRVVYAWADHFAALVVQAHAERDEAKRECAKWEKAVQSWREHYQANDQERYAALDQAFRLGAALQEAQQALAGVQAAYDLFFDKENGKDGKGFNALLRAEGELVRPALRALASVSLPQHTTEG